MLPIADVGMAFSLAEDRGLSRGRFNRHSSGFNQHSPDFVCTVLRIAALEKPPFLPSFSTGALWFTGWCALFGVQPVLSAFVTTLPLGWWSVASLTFTRKCLLRASDCGCWNGFLFSRRPRPVSQSLQSALAWFQSALTWFRLLRASDCRCGNGFL